MSNELGLRPRMPPPLLNELPPVTCCRSGVENLIMITHSATATHSHSIRCTRVRPLRLYPACWNDDTSRSIPSCMVTSGRYPRSRVASARL